MFLIRTAFWFSLVMLLLPIGRDDPQLAQGPGAWQTLSALQTTFQDLRGFCDRNPDACETGVATMDVLRARTVYAAGKVQGWIADPEVDDGVATEVAVIPASNSSVQEPQTDTESTAPISSGDPLAALIANATSRDGV